MVGRGLRSPQKFRFEFREMARIFRVSACMTQ
jgi:hypothetical protein